MHFFMAACFTFVRRYDDLRLPSLCFAGITVIPQCWASSAWFISREGLTLSASEVSKEKACLLRVYTCNATWPEVSSG